jgi:hypothetical protein
VDMHILVPTASPAQLVRARSVRWPCNARLPLKHTFGQHGEGRKAYSYINLYPVSIDANLRIYEKCDWCAQWHRFLACGVSACDDVSYISYLMCLSVCVCVCVCVFNEVVE